MRHALGDETWMQDEWKSGTHYLLSNEFQTVKIQKEMRFCASAFSAIRLQINVLMEGRLNLWDGNNKLRENDELD